MSRDETKVILEEGTLFFFFFKEASLLNSNLEATRTHAFCLSAKPMAFLFKFPYKRRQMPEKLILNNI